LSSASGNAIKRINGWREGPPVTVSWQVSICWPGLHPPGKSASNEKRILLCAASRSLLNQNIGRFKATNRQSGSLGQTRWVAYLLQNRNPESLLALVD
jgi:hypothetical protein